MRDIKALFRFDLADVLYFLRHTYLKIVYWLLKLMIVIGSVSVSYASTDCSIENINSNINIKTTNEIIYIQKNLTKIGYKISSFTGNYGPETKGSLSHLCMDLEFTDKNFEVYELINKLKEIAETKIDYDFPFQWDEEELYKRWITSENLPEEDKEWLKTNGSAEKPRSSVIYEYYSSSLPDIVWPESSCGCSPGVSSEDKHTSYLYGFYPFWSEEIKTPEESQSSIDFSVLSRIGYFSLSPNNKFSITNLRHWRNLKSSTQFIDRTHQYKGKIDLVIYDNGWKKWNGPEAEEKLEDLSSQIAKLVKDPIRGYPVNAMKPVVSFGTSPARTMGDGVTLNFDFKSDPDFIKASEDNKQNSFNNIKLFTRLLKNKLNDIPINDVNTKADKNDQYYLNVIWPVDDILNGNGKTGFYTLNNMAKLSAKVNLYILAIDDPFAKLPEDKVRGNKPNEGDGTLKKLKDFRVAIDKLSVIKSTDVLEKMLPLFVLDENESGDKKYEDYFNYAEWNYAGVGLWSIANDVKVNKLLKEIVLNEKSCSLNGVSFNSLLNAEQNICNFMCPLRWGTRIGLFVLLVITAIYSILSIWICDSKSILGKWYFIVGAFIGTLVLILTFWCDPYWKEQRDTLFFFSIIFAVITFIWLLIKKRKEALFP